MRNPAPRFNDFDDEPNGRLSAALALVRRRPIDSLAGVLAGACVAMILFNALAMQEPRRTVTSFGGVRTDAAEAVQPQRSELVAQIQGALADRGYYDGPVDGLTGSKTTGAIRTFEQDQRMPASGEANEKLLAAVLVSPARKPDAAMKTTPAPAVKTAPAQIAPPATTGSTDISAPKLMAVQKALAKLGYGPVSIDGKMGAATRAAIQTFEKDRNMPQTGEPSPKVLHALQAMTGTPLQ